MSHAPCPSCVRPTPIAHLADAALYPFWEQPGGGCPACVQQHLLQRLLDGGDEALHRAVQTAWPLDAEAAFGVLPTPLRLHADPRFTGRGTTIALVDSGFHPHPDLCRPHNRIRAWVDLGGAGGARRFSAGDVPAWPGWDAGAAGQWHGTMTSVVAAGNGFLSHGLYRGLAPEAELVLVAVREADGRITNEGIARALQWLFGVRQEFGIDVVSLSVAGDLVEPLAGNPVDLAVQALVEAGVMVVAAAGNDGVRRLVPPATAPDALTVGGLDDRNLLDHAARQLWHSNYGAGAGGAGKPELVAPSLWVAAPVLPGTDVAREAAALLAQGWRADEAARARVAELKLITPHYQHVDGTSFAAPLVASALLCLREANPALPPALLAAILVRSAEPVPDVPRERQGAGVLDAGRAVALALAERHGAAPAGRWSPRVTERGTVFALHDHAAAAVAVLGDWDGWQAPGLAARQEEPGVWLTDPAPLPPGAHGYKFLLDGARWLDDPANPWKRHDGRGGLNAVVEVR